VDDLALRKAIGDVRDAPRDPEARRALRALADDQASREQLARILADEARAAADAEISAALYEELADVYENLDQPLETIGAMEHVVALDPDDVEHWDRLAWMYRRAGAWAKAAAAFERVARLARDDRARAALRAAGKLYRDNGRADRAVEVYRAIVMRKPSDGDAWRALDELLTELGRWDDLAAMRGAMAERATGVDKAVLLRSQARALEQAGDTQAAAVVVSTATEHAPEDISGVVDYAIVLARDNRGSEAADVLRARLADAIARGASANDIAALRSRLAGILEDACGDRPSAAAVLDELLAEAPEYVPALERLVWHASHDADPRVHAQALMRYAAALPDGAERATALADAARKFREAHDHREAARVFEAAADCAPDDDVLAQELEDARTAVAVERAVAEAAAGDSAGAERRLRTILESRPHNLDANLALADLLAASGRAGEARDHLRAVKAPASARLVQRLALVTAATGDADEAHQLLHEAHRLDRKSLAITLALGESCFSRKLWREAALHLGALAEHPDAARNAKQVAAALVHAAQAEVRALRPTNAEKHYEAAVRLDAERSDAWHALAEIATERGDMARAADCLEREATTTADPVARERLFDALADLASDVLGDPARAEHYLTRVTGEAALGRLLAIQRARNAPERGDTCLRLAALRGDPKHLLIEAIGLVADPREAIARLVAAHPDDRDAIAAAAAVTDPAQAAVWLGRALAAWDAAGDLGDGDPERAELWRKLGDGERARGNPPAAVAAYERAIAAKPESPGALGARRGLLALGAGSGHVRVELLADIAEADPVASDVLAWARELATCDDDDARPAFDLARALGATIDDSDEAYLADHPPRVMASDEAYGALDAGEVRALVDDPEDVPLGELFDMLGEVAPLVCPDTKAALVDAGLADARRVSASSDIAAAALYPQIANALGGPPTLVYTTDRPLPDLQILLASPPIVVIGAGLASVRARSRSDADLGDLELRFKLGRLVEYVRSRRVFAVDRDAFHRTLAGLRHAFAGATSEDRAVAGEAERLHSALSVALRRRMTERLAVIGDPEPERFLAACERAADRAGLLACGDAAVAIETAGGPDAAPHLARFAAHPRYLAARGKLRARR
jgi:tetratricopeptide (TPR) repeat protein